LKAFRSGYVTGALNGNLEKLADYYAEDVRLMCEYNRTFLGKATASSYYKAFLSRFEVQDYTRQEIEVLDLGSRVIELGRFTLSSHRPLCLCGLIGVRFDPTGRDARHSRTGYFEDTS
jgi:hypothetical protein